MGFGKGSDKGKTDVVSDVKSVSMHQTGSGNVISLSYELVGKDQNAVTATHGRAWAAVAGIQGLDTGRASGYNFDRGMDVPVVAGADARVVAKEVVSALSSNGLITSTKAQELYKSMGLQPDAVAKADTGEKKKFWQRGK